MKRLKLTLPAAENAQAFADQLEALHAQFEDQVREDVRICLPAGVISNSSARPQYDLKGLKVSSWLFYHTMQERMSSERVQILHEDRILLKTTVQKQHAIILAKDVELKEHRLLGAAAIQQAHQMHAFSRIRVLLEALLLTRAKRNRCSRRIQK